MCIEVIIFCCCCVVVVVYDGSSGGVSQGNTHTNLMTVMTIDIELRLLHEKFDWEFDWTPRPPYKYLTELGS